MYVINSNFFVVCWGTRHTFVLLAFLGTASAYAMRINLSVAIVAMVQQGTMYLNYKYINLLFLSTSLLGASRSYFFPLPSFPNPP